MPDMTEPMNEEYIPTAAPVQQKDKRKLATLPAIIVVLIIMMGMTGGVYFTFYTSEDSDEPEMETGPFDFDEPIPGTTFYHFDGGVDALNYNDTDVLTGDNIPFWAQGTYYGIGTTTFEPTIGVTSTGSLFITSYKGTGGGTHIIRSQDQGQTWDDMGPFNQVYNSNDPYLYVDPWTDRIVKFDMHALLGMTIEFSDDEGETWIGPNAVTDMSPQDHQTIASMPPPAGFPRPMLYDTIYVYSINTGLQGGGVGGSYGTNSFDGTLTWDHPEKPHYEVGKPPASGLSGHLVGANDGSIYRGQPSTEGPAAYRSLDGGYTWTEHTITNGETQTHEVAIGTDEANNVHAFWIGKDNKPYYSNSRDHGETWREPIMVAPPHVNGTGFPTLAGGADGRAAFAYIGDTHNGSDWSGYLGVVTDAFSEQPLITTVAVNTPDDLLDTSPDAGYRRCGGFGDFIDICIDPDGRPWVAMAHNPAGEIGIVGTYSVGPALRGELDYLEPLPLGGHDTL